MIRWNHSSRAVVLFITMACLLLTCAMQEVVAAPQATPSFRVAIGWAGTRPALELVRSYQAIDHSAAPSLEFLDSRDVVQRLMTNRCDLGLMQIGMVNTSYQQSCKSFDAFDLGTMSMALVVNTRPLSVHLLSGNWGPCFVDVLLHGTN